MKPRLILTHLPQLIVAVLVAAAIKLFYSTASVDGLLWILAPTTWLVELVTGVEFMYESGAGYMSSDHSFLIAAVCSGVNFMIAAFLLLAIGRLWKVRRERAGWLFLPVSLGAAYVTTILANTVRISTALMVRRLDGDLVWVSPDQMHRFEGIVVYFGFLMLLFFVSEKVLSDDEPDRDAIRWKRWILPLAVYYATTLGVPIVNGIYKGGLMKAEFWEHSIFVLIIPLLLLAVAAAIKFIKDQRADLRIRNTI